MKFSHIRGAERVIKVISRLEISFELFLEQCLQVVRLDDFRTPVTVSNMHEVHASASCPKQCLRVLAAMPSCQQWDKLATQICTAVGLSKENR